MLSYDNEKRSLSRMPELLLLLLLLLLLDL